MGLLADGDAKRIVLQAELADAQMEEGLFDEASEVIAAAEVSARTSDDDRLTAFATLALLAYGDADWRLGIPDDVQGEEVAR